MRASSERATPAPGRIAALYDIHGNLPALDAALAAADAERAERIIVGGDVVLGPMPRETMERLLALGPRARWVRGNCDRLVVDAARGRLGERLPAGVRAAIAWTAAQLAPAHLDLLGELPDTVTERVPVLGDVLFCHATPRSDEEIFTARTPDARLRTLLDGVAERTVVCGHTHMQFDRTVDGARVVNAGSVGMPFAPPAAYWLLLGPDVRAMRTDYDVEGAAALVRATDYPQAEEFLRPMTEAEALARFEPTAGRGV